MSYVIFEAMKYTQICYLYDFTCIKEVWGPKKCDMGILLLLLDIDFTCCYLSDFINFYGISIKK